MRTIAWCVLMLSLVGCQSGPRWFMRDRDVSGAAHLEDQPLIESAPTPTPALPAKEGPTLPLPPQPAQKERAPYETSSRPRGWFGNHSTSQANRAKSTSRTTQTARRTTTPATIGKGTTQDDSVKQLMADLEKTKREKAVLETKLSEDSAKQTQQRLELEARLALLQEQMRQQSALQQVMYQQQASGMPRPNYNGPTITSGVPSPAMQMPFAAPAPNYAPQAQPQAVSGWGNPAAWNSPAPAATQQQHVEQWPYSPQRR